MLKKQDILDLIAGYEHYSRLSVKRYQLQHTYGQFSSIKEGDIREALFKKLCEIDKELIDFHKTQQLFMAKLQSVNNTLTSTKESV